MPSTRRYFVALTRRPKRSLISPSEAKSLAPTSIGRATACTSRRNTARARNTRRGNAMRLRRRRFLHLAAGAVALPALSRLSVADSYPSRRITMVVPFAPGALSDIIARVMAEGMQASLGQTVVVENAGGADGTIGSGRVAHAVPDGYTLVCANWNTSITNAAIYKLDYDVVTDFEPVVLLPAAPMVLLTKKDNPATNLTEFI